MVKSKMRALIEPNTTVTQR